MVQYITKVLRVGKILVKFWVSLSCVWGETYLYFVFIWEIGMSKFCEGEDRVVSFLRMVIKFVIWNFMIGLESIIFNIFVLRIYISCFWGSSSVVYCNFSASCYNCSKMGHIARDCPEPERTCYVCNKSGHISRQCTENKSENRNAKVVVLVICAVGLLGGGFSII